MRRVTVHTHTQREVLIHTHTHLYKNIISFTPFVLNKSIHRVHSMKCTSLYITIVIILTMVYVHIDTYVCMSAYLFTFARPATLFKYYYVHMYCLNKFK